MTQQKIAVIETLLNQRFATKKFSTMRKVSQEILNYVLECGRLSASSYNSQPWHFTVVTNPDVRKALQAASGGQAQIVEASHLIIVSALKNPMMRVEQTAAALRDVFNAERAAGYTSTMTAVLKNKAENGTLIYWAQRQSYLALQAMLLAAAERGLDSCPMEGFEPERYASILDLTEIAVPTAVLALGYADAPPPPKVRVPIEALVKWVK
jgi:nitroreductase